MIAAKKSITAIVAALAITASAYADVMPASRPDAGCVPPPSARHRADLPQTDTPNLFVDWPGDAGPDPWPVGSLPASSNADAGQAGAAKPLQVFAEDQSSLSLCLCVLMGLGLCRSAPFVKKLSIGCIPDWYHSGGPSQVGHSVAISPDCLCQAPVVCFLQRDSTTDDLPREYHRGTIASLVRQSLFTPSLLVCRGPPLSC